MSMGSGQPPGWYYAQGDPEGTHRYWDGSQWVGGPQPIGAPGNFGGGMPAPAQYGGGVAMGPGGRKLGEPGMRIAARLIDLVIGVVAGFILVAIFGIDRSNQVGLQAMMGIAGIAYEVAFTALKGGTPGKLILGLGVTTTGGQMPPGWGPAGLRWVVTAIPCIGVIVWIVSLVFLFTDPQHRTVGDRVANTLVVATK